MDTFRRVSWGAIIAGALVTTALFIIFVIFGLALGIGIGSPAPTWRDSSFAFWLLSGLYLVLRPLNEPVHVWLSGLGGKVVHLVVQEEPRARDYEAAAITPV